MEWFEIGSDLDLLGALLERVDHWLGDQAMQLQSIEAEYGYTDRADATALGCAKCSRFGGRIRFPGINCRVDLG